MDSAAVPVQRSMPTWASHVVSVALRLAQPGAVSSPEAFVGLQVGRALSATAPCGVGILGYTPAHMVLRDAQPQLIRERVAQTPRVCRRPQSAGRPAGRGPVARSGRLPRPETGGGTYRPAVHVAAGRWTRERPRTNVPATKRMLSDLSDCRSRRMTTRRKELSHGRGRASWRGTLAQQGQHVGPLLVP